MHLKNASVLAVDDDEDVLLALRILLRPLVREVITERNPDRLPALLSKSAFDIILLDMNYKSHLNTGNEGFFWLKKIQDRVPGACVIMITAYGDVELAVRSLKEGASDFVLKPWHNAKLLETLEEACERKAIKAGTAKPKATKPGKSDNSPDRILGRSEPVREVMFRIDKVAPTDANVLILGENGTGKELAARALHARSLRADKPFISVDVGSLSDTLFESELFGHKKGAFTDAREERTGRIEAAHGGTLFLDEIGNIGMAQQMKLLTVLQTRQVTPLGSNKAVPVDIRLISATNMPLYEMAAQNRFRTDLIYRINTVELSLPPLRKRTEDIPLLAEHFLAVFAEKYRRPVMNLSAEALKRLQAYSWPGNIRELQNAIERALIMADGEVLQATDFSLGANRPESHDIHTDKPAPGDEDNSLAELERSAIARVVDKHNGNISRAARELGLTRAALYRRLDKYDI
ncbi:MAG: sigma-54 dependent transcriptional regulator [Bacteroidota bacterium]